MSKYVIGDIHGCSSSLSGLLDKISPEKGDTIYFLGDYIDRGPNSKAVVDIILGLKESGILIMPLMGNHEEMMLNSFFSVKYFEQWKKNGGRSTLKSFLADHVKDIDKKYIDFFSSLKYFYLTDDYVIVHGGLNFKLSDPLKDKLSMVWERNNVVDTRKTGGRKLIVGHTPIRLKDVKKSIYHDKIMLDGGCVYYYRYPELGYLCALRLDDKELFYVKNSDYSRSRKYHEY